MTSIVRCRWPSSASAIWVVRWLKPWSATAGRLKVYDRDPARAEGIDADRAAAPAELADCRLIALAVPDDEAVDGAGERTGFTPGAGLHLLGPQHDPSCNGETPCPQAEAAHLAFLDVPVSGGAERALTGSLTVMAGGRADVLGRARPVLDSVAETVLHVGPAGAGAAVKLANQLMMFAALAGVQEALELAAAYDVPERTVLEAVSTSTGESWITRNWGFFDRVAAAYDEAGTPVRTGHGARTSGTSWPRRGTATYRSRWPVCSRSIWQSGSRRTPGRERRREELPHRSRGPDRLRVPESVADRDPAADARSRCCTPPTSPSPATTC